MIEDVAAVIQSDLQDDLNTAIAAQDTKYGDFTLDQFKDKCIYLGERSAIDEYPCIFIIPTSAPLDNEHFMEINHRSYIFDIAFVIMDNKESRIHQRVWRTARAIQNVLENITLGSPIILFKTTNVIFEAFQFVQTTNIAKAGVVQFTVLANEDAYKTGQL